MAEMMTERIQRNAKELKMLGLAENLDDLVSRAEEGNLGYRQFLDLLLEEEVGVVEGRKYASRLKLSGLPYRKTLSEFDCSFQPELDPKRLSELGSLRFVGEEGEHPRTRTAGRRQDSHSRGTGHGKPSGAVTWSVTSPSTTW